MSFEKWLAFFGAILAGGGLCWAAYKSRKPFKRNKNANGKALYWPSLPVTVNWSSVLPPEYLGMLHSAVAEWNSKFEKPIFQMWSEIPFTDAQKTKAIFVDLDEVQGDGGHLGQARVYSNANTGEIQWAEIVLELATGDHTNTLQHELGHALGLAHSEHNDSVMAPINTEHRRKVGETEAKAIASIYKIRRAA
jgi:predicted Zn-dependent protease